MSSVTWRPVLAKWLEWMHAKAAKNHQLSWASVSRTLLEDEANHVPELFGGQRSSKLRIMSLRSLHKATQRCRADWATLSVAYALMQIICVNYAASLLICPQYARLSSLVGCCCGLIGCACGALWCLYCELPPASLASQTRVYCGYSRGSTRVVLSSRQGGENTRAPALACVVAVGVWRSAHTSVGRGIVVSCCHSSALLLERCCLRRRSMSVKTPPS